MLNEIVALMKGCIGINENYKVDVDADFFALGGDSIGAGELLASIQQKYQINLTYNELFADATAAAITELVISCQHQAAARDNRIAPLELQPYVPVSAAQRRLLAIEQLDAKTSYHLPVSIVLKGELDDERFVDAYNRIVAKHQVLRTSFEWIDGELVQRIHPYEYCDIRAAANEEGIETHVERLILPFQLEQPPLIRASLIRLGSDEHLFLFNVHHAILDGYSIGLFMKELSELYNSGEATLSELQYSDFAVWQNERLKTDSLDASRSFWTRHLEGELPLLNIPTDYSRPSMQSFEGRRIYVNIEPALTSRLQQVAREQESTLFMVLLSAYYTLLSRYSNQEDIIVGVPSAGRTVSDLDRMLGMFVNTLPLRGFPQQDKTFRAFLQEMKSVVLEAFEHQEFPLEALVEKLEISRDLSRNPLFTTLFVLQNIPPWNVSLQGIEAEAVPVDARGSKLDLSVEALEIDGMIQLTVEYATKLYKEDTVRRMFEHYIQILSRISDNPHIKLQDIDMLSAEEKHWLIQANNETSAPLLPHHTLQQLFEDRVLIHPDKIAVTAPEGGQWQSLTYEELNARANQVAHALRQQGVNRNEIVALCMERSLDMMIAILGILKAGAAYLPLDIQYPQERMQYILDNSQARAVLTRDARGEEIIRSTYWGELINIHSDKIREQPTDNPTMINTGSDLAYIIYTSGSTGKPKGVMIEHRSVMNRLHWMQQTFMFEQDDVFLQKTVHTFDVSVWELFLWYFNGASLTLLAPNAEKDPEAIVSALRERNVSVIHFVPSMFNAFAAYVEHSPHSSLNKLRYIFTSGEALSAELVNACMRNPMFADVKIVNLYGPTETTIDSTYYECTSKTYINVPIGKPIANTQVYVIGSHGGLQPIGVAGELCIGGIGVARGYVNRPDLTQEKFVDNPYRPGERMYKTGDLARWLPDGTIEYLGRIDMQVKIRGYRIEPGEIENELRRHPGVRDTVVVSHRGSDGSHSLCAYVAAEPSVDTAELRSHLGKSLPDYMIPAYFVHLDQLPLNANGKVDRKALPAPEEAFQTERDYEEPDSDLEACMADIWQEVLGRERIGRNDHFFELGGDSIKGIQVCARLYKYGWKLEMRHLFQRPVLKDVCIEAAPLKRRAEQGVIEGDIELLPVQHWFFEQELAEAGHWNQAMMLQGKQRIDADALSQSIAKLVEHHDALRTVFRRDESGIKAYIRGMETSERLYSFELADFSHIDESEKAIAELTEATHRDFDLEHGPLLRVKLIRDKKHDHVLLVAHHLVIDSVSWRIVLEDLAIAYEQISSGKTPVLQDKTDSIGTWALAMRRYAASRGLIHEAPYWQRIEQASVRPLPQYSSLGDGTMRNNAIASIRLEPNETELLLKDTHKAYNTEMNDVLLTALALALKDWTGDSTALLSVEGHGREEVVDNVVVTRTVGWFTSIYPVLLTIEPEQPVGEQLKRVKETLRQIPNRGIGYGVLRYLAPSDSCEQESFRAKPEISFNYLGQFDADLNSRLFMPSSYGSGLAVGEGNRRLYALDIVGMVQHGSMTIQFQYDSGTYQQEVMERLAESYKRHLQAIIAHCTSRTEAEVTASDLAGGNVNLSDIEEIMKLFN